MRKRSKRNLKRIEHHASRVVFDPVSREFVVTWSKCNMPIGERLKAKKDVNKWIPSISAIMNLYDRGCIQMSNVDAAIKSIFRAWDAGDRHGLDSIEAKNRAEFVVNLYKSISSGVIPSAESKCNISLALRQLMDEIAKINFANASIGDFEYKATLQEAIEETCALDGFATWIPLHKRKAFLSHLKPLLKRNPVIYTLAGVYFGIGACPILTISDKRALGIKMRGFNSGNLAHDMQRAFSSSMCIMKEAKEDGLNSLGLKMTQSELLASVEHDIDVADSSC